MKDFWTPQDLGDFNYNKDLGNPGEFPFTRGIYSTMYRDKLWTMRQYAGLGDAKETNARFHFLLSKGQTGLSLAFDLPTQLGYDSDSARAFGEVGKVGVAISCLDDMAILFQGIPLDKVSTAMTINATAPMILGMYIILAQNQGVAIKNLSGTVQNDILKEYIARGNYIFPVKPSMGLAIDLWEYCIKEIPKFYMVSISGYHIRETGATAVEELSFTFANGIAYIEAALERGLKVDDFGPRLSFFFGVHNNFCEEIAKFRAGRRIWARIMRDRFKAQNPKSWMMRFHSQTCGSTLTAQEPENNIVRVTLQALAAVLGGTQSLHTNSYDEALCLPQEKSVALALRTQQIIALESNIPSVCDPLGGSYYLEKLTNEIEEEVIEELKKIESQGGAVNCIENGYIQKRIDESAYRTQKRIEEGKEKIIGVNIYPSETECTLPILKVKEELAQEREELLKEYRTKREQEVLKDTLNILADKSLKNENLIPFLLKALSARATLGEICDVLRRVWGEYDKRY